MVLSMLIEPTHEMLQKDYFIRNLSIDAVVQWTLATPVQFWLGWDFYVASYKGTPLLLLLLPQSTSQLLDLMVCSVENGAWAGTVLKHGSANMDVLVALGTSAAYFYSVLGIILHLVDENFTSHLYFETSALLITFIMLGRCLTSSPPSLLPSSMLSQCD